VAASQAPAGPGSNRRGGRTGRRAQRRSANAGQPAADQAQAGNHQFPAADQEAATGRLPAADHEAAAGQEAVAREICLRLLAFAPRTRAQLAATLRRRGVPDEAAEAVLGRFADVGLINDAMFASAWVESRHYSKGLSGRALGAELRNQGVAADDILAAVGQLQPEQEIATARSLVASRMAATSGQPPVARVRRMIGTLARKGYSPALAYRLVREALEQEGIDLAAAGLELDDVPDISDAPDELAGPETAGQAEAAGW
jgi:regulatory protein